MPNPTPELEPTPGVKRPDAQLVQDMKDDVQAVMFLCWRSYPFFAYLLEHMTLSITYEIPTAAVTNTGYLYVNPDFWQKQTRPQKVGLIAHEVCHIAFRHFERSGGRHGLLWNMANDYMINWRLEGDGLKLPEGGCTLSRGYSADDIDEVTSEELYALLREKVRRGKIQLPGDGPGQQGTTGETTEQIHKSGPNGRGQDLEKKLPNTSHTMDQDLQNQQKMKDLQDMINRKFQNAADIRENNAPTPKNEEDWKMQVERAYVRAKMAGKEPAHMKDLIGDLLDPKITWKDQLIRSVRDFVARDTIDNYTFRRPSRRANTTDVILPSTIGHKKRGIVSIDTSGSMYEYWLQAVSDFNHVRTRYKIDFYLMWQDADIYAEGWIPHSAPLPKERQGGGGTSFGIILDHCEENKLWDQADFLVIFTDLYGSFGQWEHKRPPVKTIVVTYTDERAPSWAEVIRIKM